MEAAGISRFRHKRKDAERRLDQAQENLVRLLDILGELESRVGPLKKQSEKAQKFLEYSEEKKTLEIGVWLNKINRFTVELREQEHKIDAANASYDICEKVDSVLRDMRKKHSAKTAKSAFLMQLLNIITKLSKGSRLTLPMQTAQVQLLTSR